MGATDVAIVVEGLRKRYGEKHALDGFDLAVPAGGTVCGLLGPNGAGKTTAVRILATLLRGDGGRAEVAGYDVRRQADEVRRRIGLVGQRAAVDEVLGGRQNLVLFGRLHHIGKRAARGRADELLERFGLADAAGKQVKRYSGGMRRRLDLAVSMITNPNVLFLDEPTTGLDPRGRGEVWQALRSLVADGTTVLLTTQYLDEADQLADQISMIDHGRMTRTARPISSSRRSAATGRRRRLQRPRTAGGGRHGRPDHRCGGRSRRRRPPDQRCGTRPDQVVRGLDAEDVGAEDIAVRRPTLDEVFLQLTGHRREATEDERQEVPA